MKNFSSKQIRFEFAEERNRESHWRKLPRELLFNFGAWSKRLQIRPWSMDEFGRPPSASPPATSSPSIVVTCQFGILSKWFPVPLGSSKRSKVLSYSLSQERNFSLMHKGDRHDFNNEIPYWDFFVPSLDSSRQFGQNSYERSQIRHSIRYRSRLS